MRRSARCDKFWLGQAKRVVKWSHAHKTGFFKRGVKCEINLSITPARFDMAMGTVRLQVTASSKVEWFLIVIGVCKFRQF